MSAGNQKGNQRDTKNGLDALNGLKILDFTWVLAGPTATKFLADHGAEVIKIERRELGDRVRTTYPYAEDEPGTNRSGYFCNVNRGKYGVTLNLKDPRGIELIKKLVARSDVVFENFAAEVMAGLGLGYEQLKEIKPDIIMISMSGMGHTGPYQEFISYGPTLQALSGLTYLTGFPDRDPVGPGFSYSDFAGGWAGVLACLHALHYKNRTGKGQWVDVSQLEGLCVLMGPGFLDFSVNKRIPERMGNRHPFRKAAPHGAYRCEGEDKWCAITVFTEDEWQGFCRALKNPPWTREERFSTMTGRIENMEALDQLVEEWTNVRSAQEVMELLQREGVPAGVVQEAPDLVDKDPQLRHRGFWVELDHPELGIRKHEGVSFTFTKTPGRLKRPAPLLGEHNDYVFGEILGMTPEEIKKYTDEEVF
ncbi:MAG: CoA transferase [Deltaproteobacteria bacterium]|nr:CoA transferase [Deltaproteobacteria bacterium]